MNSIRPPTWVLKTIGAIVIATTSIAIFAPWLAAYVYLKPLAEYVQEEVSNAVNYNLDGMIVYVEQSDKPPALYSAGWHNRQSKIPADPQALFKIASISKLYVAVAISKLVNDKRLSLDKTLADYFPELDGRIENANKITLRLMVQHRSGIPNYTDHPDYFLADSTKDKLELVLDLPANFEPDTDYGYSNTNYLLISRLMDKVLGYSHNQFIEQEILIPLGLTKTYSSMRDVDITKMMSGYHVGYESDLKTDNHGSMIATAEDVGKFLRALNDGSVFVEDEQAIYASLYVYNHNGLIPGYQSFARYYQDIDTVVVLFVNTTNFNDFGLVWLRKLYLAASRLSCISSQTSRQFQSKNRSRVKHFLS
jgi:D-alanyl-D-alanine carboxypeptidase